MPHHLRRADREITDLPRIRALLNEGRYCTIALFDGEPYAVTLSYGYDASSGRLYFHCADAGRKIDAIGHGSRACATVVHDRGYKTGECAQPFESVVLHGSMHVITDPAEKLHGLRVLVQHQEESPDAFSQMGLDDPVRANGVTALAFCIERLSAKAGE
jgi:nitroimidazol reductase NimA-like FMN-containing flavoprotein (pyridoxamine 5'-phosphate oxidase superfamily)